MSNCLSKETNWQIVSQIVSQIFEIVFFFQIWQIVKYLKLSNWQFDNLRIGNLTFFQFDKLSYGLFEKRDYLTNLTIWQFDYFLKNLTIWLFDYLAIWLFDNLTIWLFFWKICQNLSKICQNLSKILSKFDNLTNLSMWQIWHIEKCDKFEIFDKFDKFVTNVTNCQFVTNCQ